MKQENLFAKVEMEADKIKLKNKDHELIGYIATDVILRRTKDNKPYCFFEIGLERETKHEDDYMPVQTFGPTAESLAASAQKGDIVIVRGAIRSRKKEDSGGKMIKHHFIEVSGLVLIVTADDEQAA